MRYTNWIVIISALCVAILSGCGTVEFSSSESGLIDNETSKKISVRHDIEVHDAAVEAYGDIFNSIRDIGREKYGDTTLAKFDFGYIDADEIPELLVSYGDFHGSGVCIYTYLADRDEVVYVGEFSSFGELKYVFKKNCIISTYGNHGYYITYFSELDLGTPHLIDAILCDGSGLRSDNYLYYHGFDFSSGIDGSKEAFEKVGTDPTGVENDENLLISEEKYNSLMSSLTFKDEDSEIRNSSYGNMNYIPGYVQIPISEHID